MNTPSNTPIPLCAPHLTGNEWDYIRSSLDDGWVSSAGPFVDKFESLLKQTAGTGNAVATVNGTTALHIAFMVAGVQRGDEVIISDLTFVAPVNALHYIDAVPVLVDAEPDYWQLDVEKVARFLESSCEMRDGKTFNRHTHRRVAAICPVHILGHPVDMDPLLELAAAYNLKVISDTSEAVGTLYRGQPAAAFGDLATYSFNGNKIVTAGNGGAVLTNNDAYAEKARYLTTQAKDDPFEYIHGEVGYNYRLSNISAALGYAQLEQLEGYVTKKRRIAETYAAAFAGVAGIEPMREATWAYSTYWMYTVRVDPAQYGRTSRELSTVLSAANISTRPLWRPMHMLDFNANAVTYQLEHTPALYREALSLPCSVGLTEEDQQRVIDHVLDGR